MYTVYKKQENGLLVEAMGVEPMSAKHSTKSPTCLVFISSYIGLKRHIHDIRLVSSSFKVTYQVNLPWRPIIGLYEYVVPIGTYHIQAAYALRRKRFVLEARCCLHLLFDSLVNEHLVKARHALIVSYHTSKPVRPQIFQRMVSCYNST